MQRNITNEECQLYGTPQCDFLNMLNCEGCFVNNLEDDASQRVISDLQVLEGLLPEEGIHGLFLSEECLLCKGADKGKRSCYAMVDLGHPEPKRKKRTAIGFKTYAKIGSMVPVQISACNSCRRRILILEYLHILLPVAAGVIALIIFTLPGVSGALVRVSGLLPLALFCVTIGLSLAGAFILNRSLTKKYSEHTVLDPFELPTLAKMSAKGWFPLNTSNTLTRMVFSKKRMRHGVGTGIPHTGQAPTQ